MLVILFIRTDVRARGCTFEPCTPIAVVIVHDVDHHVLPDRMQSKKEQSDMRKLSSLKQEKSEGELAQVHYI